ncbi:hypothetical protein MSG28_014570 [Choristoneura fumiferana]|uniref:Uncharacterized protein n=2 Tax=Choristoneura fumiferana TaxID=7141 RepID=A0ACC0JRU1_CHOFU|nr:hypothetical protein MSG28_014570 [Choristoneura fumiferana]KAI8426896.1 hypothetical protein MSG28_014570 [Choristoneura fumiferana]
MEEHDFVGCISCMNTNDLYNLFATYTDNVETYAKMFETCFELKVLDVSRYICASCAQKLEEAYVLKEQTLKNIAMLQSIKGDLEEEYAIQALDETTCIYCDLQLSNANEMPREQRRCRQPSVPVPFLRQQFMLFKSAIQEETKYRFRKTTASKQTIEGIRSHYMCSQSGVYVCQGKGKRPAPERQIYKTGKACPAHMIVTETTEGVLKPKSETVSSLMLPDQELEIMEKHDVDTAWICDSCGMGFMDSAKFRDHVATHGLALYPCQYCSNFPNTTALPGQATVIAAARRTDTPFLPPGSRDSAPLSTSVKALKDEKVKVTFVLHDGKRIESEAKVGDTLLDVIVNNDLNIEGYGACEGTLTCSTCHVILKQDDYDRLPEEASDEERDMLDLAYGLTDTSRLGCQITMTKELDGLEVQVPETINDARS